MNYYHSLTEQQLQAIALLLKESIANTFQTLFQVDLQCHTLPKGEAMPGHSYICRANLNGNDEQISLFFSFDETLLYLLLKDVYPNEMLDDPAIFADAASEIANIVGNSVKTYLIGQGFQLALEIPYAEKMNNAQEECVHLHFSLHNAHLYIDMTTDFAAAQ